MMMGTSSKRTVPGPRLVFSQGRARRREVGHHVLRRLGALVAREVRMVSGVEKALAGLALDRRARRVLGVVEAHSSLGHLDEHRARVAVPATGGADGEFDDLNGE